jgi:general secretion pathway protein L
VSEVLLIRLGSHAVDSIAWMLYSDAAKEVIQSGELKGAAELSVLHERAQKAQEVRVLVPACDVTFRTVVLPGKFNRQMQTALPYMLEDDLAQDVDNLFFAIGEKIQIEGKPAVEIAAVDRELMTRWLGWLADAQIHTAHFIPDALCLPIQEHGICGIEINQQWLVRADKWSCDSVDSIWFEQYLKMLADKFDSSKDEDSEDAFTFITYSACSTQVDNVVVEDKTTDLALELLMPQAGADSFNLLQGDFVLKKESSKTWQMWKQAAILAGVAILIQLTYRGTMAWHYSSAVDTEKSVFVDQFKKAFVGDRTRTALMERQLKNKLKAAQGGGKGESGFLQMLAQVAPLFSQAQGFAPDSFKFDAKRNELRVQAIGDSFQSFEKFKSAAEKLGFVVQQGSLSNANDKVAGAVTIKRAG